MAMVSVVYWQPTGGLMATWHCAAFIAWIWRTLAML